jgi:Pre-toxin TG
MAADGIDPDKARGVAKTIAWQLGLASGFMGDMTRLDANAKLGMRPAAVRLFDSAVECLEKAAADLTKAADDSDLAHGRKPPKIDKKIYGTPTGVSAAPAAGFTPPPAKPVVAAKAPPVQALTKARYDELIDEAATLLVTDPDGPAKMIRIQNELVRGGVPLDRVRQEIWERATIAIAVATDLELNRLSGDIGDPSNPVPTASASFKFSDERTQKLAKKVNFEVELVASISLIYVASVLETYGRLTVGEVRALKNQPPAWFARHLKITHRKTSEHLKEPAVLNPVFIDVTLLAFAANSGDPAAARAVQELASGLVHTLIGFTGPFGAGFFLGEAIVGRDVLTNRKLSAGERVVKAVPAIAFGLGAALRIATSGAKAASTASEISGAGEGVVAVGEEAGAVEGATGTGAAKPPPPPKPIEAGPPVEEPLPAEVKPPAAVPATRSYRSPASRHTLKGVKQSTVAKASNTVIEPGVDVASDVAAINSGKVPMVNGQFTVNGRTYGMHDGTLYPISGTGFIPLTRGAFKALGIFNEFGNTARAAEILAKMGLDADDIAAGLNAWKAGR